MPLAPDVPYEIGEYAFGGYVAGLIDTTQGNIIPEDASQTGLRYMLIVAPASLETSRQYKTASSAAPAAARTRWDGLSATQAMNSSTYPAAQYCAGLTPPDSEASAWYLPAMDELELIYRVLKATTESNYVYTRIGHEFPGGSQDAGYNPSSDPSGAAYTSTVPGQTSVSAFHDGGGQDLGDAGANIHYWSATEYSASDAWFQNFSGSNAGYQFNSSKTASYRVRPVRRVLVSDLNTAPDAPTLTTPADGSTLNRQQDQTFQWQFNDPDTGDSQSAYLFAYRLVGATTWTETGWVTSTTAKRVVPAGTFAAGDYEWRVYTKDSQGLASPPSATGFFTAGDPPPGPSITDPANNGTIPTAEYEVVWSTPDQDAYQLRVLDGTTVVYDTGQVDSTTARSRVVAFPDNDVQRVIELTVLFGGLWSPASTVTVTVSYTPPPVPWVTATPVSVIPGVPPSAIRVDVEDPRLRVDARNLLTNPSGEATSGTVVVRENAVTNPRAAVDLTGVGGYSGSETITRVTGQTLPDGVPGDTAYQVSWSAGATNPGIVASTIMPPGSDRIGSVWVKRTSGTGKIAALFSGYGTFTAVDLPLNVWTRLSVTLPAALGGASQFGVDYRGTAPDAGSMLVTGLLTEVSPVVGDYFDGSTSPDPDLTPEWLGTPHASKSRLVGPAPVGWTGAYYSTTRERIAALPGGATYTLVADPGPATLVVETETDTVHTPHTGTAVTVTEPYFRAAVVAGDYTGPYFDGDTPDDDTYTYRWTGPVHASTSERLTYGTTGELAESTEPFVVAHDVWVRGGPEGEIRLAADLPASQPYTWHLPASDVEYEFRARAIGENGTSSWSEWVA